VGDYTHSDDPYYQWNSSWEALYVKQPNKNIDGDDHYFCKEVDYSGGSFILTFDLYGEMIYWVRLVRSRTESHFRFNKGDKQ